MRTQKNGKKVALFMGSVVLWLSLVGFGQQPVPTMMNYQGRLCDTATGEPVPDANYSVTFRIYNDETSGTLLWSETQSVTTKKGVFGVLLGGTNPISLSFDEAYWFSVQISGEPESARNPIVSVGYAFRSEYSNDRYTDAEARNAADDITSWGHSTVVSNLNADMLDGQHFSSTWPTNLGNIRSACSNDFHNIGGADDDIPDSDGEVPDNISVNNGRLYAPSGGGNVGIGTTSATSKLTVHGDIRMNTSGGALSAWLRSSGDVGLVEAYGPNGNLNARLNYLSGNSNYGHIGVYDDGGTRRVGVYVNSTGGGGMHTIGPNGNTNVNITYLSSYPNNGYVEVKDASGNTQAGMYVDSSGEGVVYGDVKSFRVANPSQPDTEIWYACPEGPEAAAYVRGTGHLTNGRVEIILPDHFVAVASPQRITVQVTPLSGESKGLAVVEKAVDRFVVQELAGGTGTYDFDYMVMAVRKRHENYQVIRSVSEAALAAPAESGG